MSDFWKLPVSRPRDQPAPGLDFQQLLVKADGRLGLHFLNRPPAAPESGKTTQEWSAGSAGLMGCGPLWLVGPCGNFQGSIGFACRSYSRSV